MYSIDRTMEISIKNSKSKAGDYSTVGRVLA